MLLFNNNLHREVVSSLFSLIVVNDLHSRLSYAVFAYHIYNSTIELDFQRTIVNFGLPCGVNNNKPEAISMTYFGC